ncbi:MAG: carbon-nitrogen hydrolase family protein [Planctomycetes bacterium]|nr:carbon-nitrogen hydrolase family protein [Planctomycetota bacterium]
MDKGVLKVATCQFGVSADIEANATKICEQMQQSRDMEVDIVHFSECALSGYAGVDFESFDDYNWDLLKEKTLEIIELAGILNVWVVLGSSHRLTEPNKPHNSLYLISPEGKLVDRYDKRFGTVIDLNNYTPGNRSVVFDINGVTCSLLICFDLRFPELYRELYKEGVKCVFQSFYNARQQGPSVHTDIMRQTMQANAANNGLWASMSNSCGWFCPYPSCFIQPDGKIVSQLKDHTEGLMVNTVDTNEKFYDPSAPFREMVIKGKLNNTIEEIDDKRSENVSEL